MAAASSDSSSKGCPASLETPLRPRTVEDDEREQAEADTLLQKQLLDPEGYDVDNSEDYGYETPAEAEIPNGPPPILLPTPREIAARQFAERCPYQDLATQELATQVIMAKLQTPSLEPRVILLSGPPSTGKTTCARIFATLANQEGDLRLSPDARFGEAYDEDTHNHPYFQRIRFLGVQRQATSAIAEEIFKLYERLRRTPVPVQEVEPSERSEEETNERIHRALEILFAGVGQMRATGEKLRDAALMPLSKSAASPPSIRHRAMRTAVLLLDDFDRLGGKASAEALALQGDQPVRTMNAMMWSFLAKFFESGSIVYKENTHHLPKGWRLVIFMIDNVSADLLPAKIRNAVHADPVFRRQLTTRIQTRVGERMFQNDSGLITRIQKSTVIPFLDYNPDQLQQIIRDEFMRKARDYKLNTSYHIYYDHTFVNLQIENILASKEDDLERKLRLIFYRNIQEPTERALAEGIPPGKGIDHWEGKAVLLSANRDAHRLIQCKATIVGDHSVRLTSLLARAGCDQQGTRLTFPFSSVFVCVCLFSCGHLQTSEAIWGVRFGFRRGLQSVVIPDEFLVGCIHAICVAPAATKQARFRCDWNVLRYLQIQYAKGEIEATLDELKAAVSQQLETGMKKEWRNWTDRLPYSGCRARFSYGFQIGLRKADSPEQQQSRYEFEIRPVRRGAVDVQDPLLARWKQQFKPKAGERPIELRADIYCVFDCETKQRMDMEGDFMLGTSEVRKQQMHHARVEWLEYGS
jgi:hypothetical protein